MNFKKAYTFDDLMLVPKYSTIKSRKEPSTQTRLGYRDFSVNLEIPIISAPMNTVTESSMAAAMSELGACSVIHRYMSINNQCNTFLNSLLPCEGYKYEPYAAIGASGDFLERSQELYKCGCRQFCVDVANGHSEACVDAVKKLRMTFGEKCSIMAGNVCTADGVKTLEDAGADVIRVGIGPGAMCTTRLVTGFGVPQLTAIQECSEVAYKSSIVADGGIRSSGDIVKAIAMGADAVMIGALIAGTDESPGETKRDEETGHLYKYYHGMASQEGRDEWFGREVSSFVPEGSSTKVPHRGSAKKIVENLNNSLKVGMSFANARTLSELQRNAEWVEVSENGRIEGTVNKRLFK